LPSLSSVALLQVLHYEAVVFFNMGHAALWFRNRPLYQLRHSHYHYLVVHVRVEHKRLRVTMLNQPKLILS